jgi:uncharacterized membrane protein
MTVGRTSHTVSGLFPVTGGTIIFKPINENRTEIELHMDYDPEGFKETAASVLGAVERRVDGDLKRFKEFIEARGVPTGEWRGEIIHGATDDDQSQLRRKDPGT